MHHQHRKRVVLFTVALLALFLLVGPGVGVSTSRGTTVGTPCCERHAPAQAAFPMMQRYADTPCCEHQTPAQATGSSISGGEIAGTPCCERRTPTQAT